MIVKITNNLINSLMRKSKKEMFLIYKLVYNVLINDRIIKTQFELIEWDIIQDKFQGVIVDEMNLLVVFASALSSTGKTKGRNTYLPQPFAPAYYFAKVCNYNISVSINPLDLGKTTYYPPYVQLFFRELLTINVKINDSLNQSQVPFVNLQEFLDHKNISRNKNHSNESTYFEIIDDNINIFGKLDGANFGDTLLFCETIKNLVEEQYNILFYDITKPIAKNTTQHRLGLIEKIGINIRNEENIEKKLHNALETNDEEKTALILLRNQALFKKNIYKKYFSIDSNLLNRCFCCGYNISSNLVGAHIHRVADIKKEFSKGLINKKEALKMMVSGDNGFLLCPNHDKEFEKGFIIFSIIEKKFILNDKYRNNKMYTKILESLRGQLFFSNCEFSNNFIKNVEKHHNRTLNINLNLSHYANR